METIDSLILDYEIKRKYGTALKEAWLVRMRLKDKEKWAQEKKLSLILAK